MQDKAFSHLDQEEKKLYLLKIQKRLRMLQADKNGKKELYKNLLGIKQDTSPKDQPFPLTDIQEAYLVGRLIGSESERIGCHTYLEFQEAKLDINALNQAWNRLIQHHMMLHTIILSNGQQRIVEPIPLYNFKIHDLQDKDDVKLQEHIQKLRNKMSHKVYAPGQWPFFEIAITIASEQRFIIHFSFDMLIADATSIELILRQWYQLYENPEMHLPELSFTFRDYIATIKELEQSSRYKRDLSYWNNRLSAMPDKPALHNVLSQNLTSRKVKSGRKRFTYELKKYYWQKLKDKGVEMNVSPSTLLLTLFLEIISKWSENKRYSIILTYFNRPPLHPHINEIVGPFTSTSILIVDELSHLSLEDKTKHFQKQLWDDLDHMSVSGISTLRSLKSQHKLKADVSIPIVFTAVLGNDSRKQEQPTWSDKITYSVMQTPQVLLDHQVFEKDNKLYFSWDVANDYFQGDVMKQIFEDYCHLLERTSDQTDMWKRKHKTAELNDIKIHNSSDKNNIEGDYPRKSIAKDLILIVDKPARHEQFPLTDQQSAYLFGRTGIGFAGNLSCQAYQEFEIENIDIPRLNHAINKLINIHDMLKVVVSSKGYQKFKRENLNYAVKVYDLKGKDSSLIEKYLQDIRQEMIKNVFPLDQWPFFDFRVSLINHQNSRLHIAIDLLILDGNSIQLLIEQLFRLYTDSKYTISVPGISFRDYVITLNKYKKTKSYEDAVYYWETKFSHIASGPSLPLYNQNFSNELYERRRYESYLDNWSTIKKKAEELSVPSGMILLAAYAEVIAHFTQNTPFTLVVVNWERLPLHKDIDLVLGDFTALTWITIMPLNVSFSEKIKKIHRNNEKDMTFQAVSGLQVLRKKAFKKNDDQMIGFPVVFTNFLTRSYYELPDGIKRGFGLSHTPQVFMDNISVDLKDSLYFHWDILKGIYDEDLIQEMFDSYCRLLEELSLNPDSWEKPVFTDIFKSNDVKSFEDKELFRKIKALNNTDVDYSLDRCLYQYIEDQVNIHPQNTALIFEDQELNYRELNERAHQWACYLKRLGCGPDQIIGIMMERSFEMVIALLAVLKADGAYLPIDTTFPQKRISFMLEDANVSILLTQERFKAKLNEFRGHILVLDGDRSEIERENTTNFERKASPENLAYVIYTSGSTGMPKGCMITHKAICNRLFWMQDTFQLVDNDRILQKTPYTFDVSVWEFFWPLLNGAALVIAKPESHKDSHYLVNIIQKQNITICHFVPSMLRFFINEKEVSKCRSLKKIFTSGEELHYTLMENTMRVLNAEIYNLYGPTEAAVDVSYWRCCQRSDRIVPIGRPVANTQLYILDEHHAPVPMGEAGELYIGGVQLARGYLKRPELTEERFIENPFKRGSKLYKTGDQARHLSDGNIQFLGRLDFQVKLRGQRIELGEIEEQLKKHKAIKEAVVLVRAETSNDPKLVAYVVTQETYPSLAKSVKEFLRITLPEFMIPNFIVPIKNIPVTSHGKLDRNALPWPITSSNVKDKTMYSPDVTNNTIRFDCTGSDLMKGNEGKIYTLEEITNEIVYIFKDILEIDEIDPHEDVFDYGMTSLTLVNAIQKINEKYDYIITGQQFGDFMEDPSIQFFANYIYRNAKNRTDTLKETPSEEIKCKKKDKEKIEIAPVDISKEHPIENQSSSQMGDQIEKYKKYREEIVIDLDLLDFNNENYQKRSCQRNFLQQTISFETFSRFLSLLKPQKVKGTSRQKYLYPSAGGKNSVQVYFYFRDKAVQGIDQGIYYYHPEMHALFLINDRPNIDVSIHLPHNCPVFEKSAFSIFFIAQKAAIEPIYLGYTNYLVTLDAGYMGQLLMSRQAQFNIGLCPIGGIDFSKIHSQFYLDQSHVFIHCLLGGTVNYQENLSTIFQPHQGIGAYIRSNPSCVITHFKEQQLYKIPEEEDTYNKKVEFTYMSRREMVLFQRQKLHLRKFEDTSLSTPLSMQSFEKDSYIVRSSQREYTGKEILLKQLGQFLSLLKPKIIDGSLKYLYPSFGSLYKISTYLYVKKDAVHDLREGIYYYDSIRHRLSLVTSRLSHSIESCQSPFNRQYCKVSGFSIFFIADLAEMDEILGPNSLHYALLEAGYMGQLLMEHQAEFNIGICPIGGLNFDRIREDFRLKKNQMLVHSFIGGHVDYQKVNRSINALKTTEQSSFQIVSIKEKKSNQFIKEIAIVGIAGQYPGASTLECFWNNLKHGINSITEVPEDRWNIRKYYDPNPKMLKTYTKWGGFLDCIDGFDSLMFNISPMEAKAMDPQERLCLENVWHCLENAGYTASMLNRQVKKVGVYIGVMWSDYQNIGLDEWRKDNRSLALSLHSSIANRISYFFDFNGPSLAIDTSCSSALTAIHLACDSIKKGECEAAIVSGINIIGHPYHQEILCRLNLLSDNEKSSAFSVNGKGWVVGEGVGTILLKPRRLAEENGDYIYGLIKGTAINYSGRAARYGAQNVHAQVDSIVNVMKNAAIPIESINYIETAATGASIADASEINALKKVFDNKGLEKRSVIIGSVKPNIGHLESASAMSQLTKVLLQLKHKEIAPSLYWSPINPLLEIENTCFKIANNPTNWVPTQNSSGRPYPRRALINAFGATGSSGHMIIEEYENERASMPVISENSGDEELIVLSASNKEKLMESVHNIFAYLSKNNGNEKISLRDMAFTLQTGRIELEERLAIVARNIEDLKEKLSFFLQEKKNIGDVYCGSVASVETDKEIIGKTYDLKSKIDWHTIAQQWVKGLCIEWEHLHKGKRNRVPLPNYPFASNSHWIHGPINPKNNKQSYANKIYNNFKYEELSQKTLINHLKKYLKAVFSEVTEIPENQININKNFAQYGLNSFMIIQLNDLLEKDLGKISKTLFFECQTISELSNHIADKYKDKLIPFFKISMEKNMEVSHQRVSKIPNTPSPIPLAPIHEQENKCAIIDTASMGKKDNDIAIVGLSGRYPKAENIQVFWQNLVEGKDCIEEIPENRWQHSKFYDSDKTKKGKVYSKWGGFIDNVDKFDPLFFNISPLEAIIMDPQERLFLEIAWETLEDAGYSKRSLNRMYNGNVGVFVGVMYSEYQLYASQLVQNGVHIAFSPGYGSIANRVSYYMGFHGPSMAIDTLSSSSLTSLHLAVESIKRKECKAAIVGGVNLSIHPNKYILQSQINMASSDGRCRSFGIGGDGIVPGEGVGAIFIKPMIDALENNDHIYGVIKGTAINHNGGTSNYTLPSPNLQKQVILQAIKQANINPRTITYIEAHSTGKSLGDSIEITSLTNAFNEYTDNKQYCSIGSVKTNIGHLEAAAGIAGLTKVLLQMKHRTLVPSLHSKKTNPNINFKETPFYVQQHLNPWPQTIIHENGQKTTYPRRAGISAFGSGGSNAHIIIEEYESKTPHTSFEIPKNKKNEYLILLSAKNSSRLKIYAQGLLSFLKKEYEEIYDKSISIQTIQTEINAAILHIFQIADSNLNVDESLNNLGFDPYSFSKLSEQIKKRFAIDHWNLDYSEELSIQKISAYVYNWLNAVSSSEDKNNLSKPHGINLDNIAYTLQVGREHMETRLALIVENMDELIEKLNRYIKDEKGIIKIYTGEVEVTGDIAEILTDGIEGEEFYKIVLENKNYDKIARLWTIGVEFDWDLLYKENKPQRVSLPAYPFERKRCWFESAMVKDSHRKRVLSKLIFGRNISLRLRKRS